MKKTFTPISRRKILQQSGLFGAFSTLLPLSAWTIQPPDKETSPQLSTSVKEHPTSTPEVTTSLQLPNHIYTTAGVETNIYFDNIVQSNLPVEWLHIDVIAQHGQQFERFWRFTPTVTAEEPFEINIKVFFDGQLLTSKKSIVHIHNQNSAAIKPLKVLCIGDSTTAGGQYIHAITRDYTQPDFPFSFVGSLGQGTDRHEGRGGWKFIDYITPKRGNDYRFQIAQDSDRPGKNDVYSVGNTEFKFFNPSNHPTAILGKAIQDQNIKLSNGVLKKISGKGPDKITFSQVKQVPTNPFWNPSSQSLDFKYYLSANNISLASTDLVTLHLGINDIFNGASNKEIDSILSQCKLLINDIRKAVNNINIGVCLTIPPSISQDAFARSYKSGQTLHHYMEIYHRFVTRLLEVFDRPEMMADRIYCIGFNTCIDRKYNFHPTEMPANARNPKPIPTWTNGVHPDDSGYYQMGDTLYGFMKYLLHNR